MLRREVLLSAGLMFLAGCSSKSNPSNETSTPTSTEIPETPKITEVHSFEVAKPLAPNAVGFRIHYTNLDASLNYSIRASVEIGSERFEKTISLEKKPVIGYPGITGGGIEPPEDASTESTFVPYELVLLEEGEQVDTVEGSLSYE
jgi:hypothetical protein